MFNTIKTQPEPENTAGLRSRPKRCQVARACAWCRAYRIKCDASYPCRNCKEKGRKCTLEKSKEEIRTFSQAMMEIGRLKKRVRELEDRLKGLSEKGCQGKPQDQDTLTDTQTVCLPTNLDPLAQHGSNRRYYNWDVVSTQTANFNQQTYGPSSSFYFIGHMASCLDSSLQHRLTDIYPACTRASNSPLHETAEKWLGRKTTLVSITHEHDLSRSQEEALLTLYWQTYHTLFPVIDQVDFKAHYNSLWDDSKALRQGSALVDIILALCMQYEAALTSSSGSILSCESNIRSDATTTGSWLHRRGQHLLADELEEPTLTTVQSHLFSVLWLSNVGLHNMAHSILAAGIRAAIIIGLHLESPEDVPIPQSQFQKRLWWSIYALEMKFAMELGRPLAINFGQVTCSLPNDEKNHLDPALSNGTLFNSQYIKLLLATRAIFVTFYWKCGGLLGRSGKKTLYQDPKILEECAEFLASRTGYLHTWLQHVPHTFKHPRKTRGEAYSTSDTELDLACSTEPVRSLQSIYLELVYHKLSMSLYRPFITFTGSIASKSTVVESHAISCMKHAIAITDVIHQCLTAQNYLGGWLQTFHWQWNATLSLIGYILAYPAKLEAHIARRALDTAMLVFERQALCNPSAVTASTVVNDLIPKIDLLVSRAQISRLFGNDAIIPTDSQLPEVEGVGSDVDRGTCQNRVSDLGHTANGFEDTFAQTSGFAFTPDCFGGLDDVRLDGETMFDFLNFDSIEEL